MDRIPKDADGHSLLSLSTPLGERSFGANWERGERPG